MNRPKLGVISAIGLGYEAVVRALWVLLIPVALDFYFWQGPHLSIRPVFERLIAAMSPTAALGPSFQQNFEEVRQLLQAVSVHFNLFSLLATDLFGLRFLPVPSLKAFELPAPEAPASAPSIITLDNTFFIITLSMILLAAGLLIGVIYLTQIADRTRVAPETLRPWPQRVVVYWVRLLLFVGLLAGAYFIAGIPFFMLLGLATLIHIALASLVMLLGWTVSFWTLLYLWFVVYAIVMADAGVLRSIWISANIVQRNLLSTFGFILLSYLIGAGMLVIWQQLEQIPFGSVMSIIGNAFIGSGLIAATFVFYQDRYRAWRVTGDG